MVTVDRTDPVMHLDTENIWVQAPPFLIHIHTHPGTCYLCLGIVLAGYKEKGDHEDAVPREAASLWLRYVGLFCSRPPHLSQTSAPTTRD